MAEPLRTAVVGFGYWGANLVRNVDASPHLQLMAIADREPANRERAEAGYPRARAVEDLEAVLAMDDVEAVVLATPAQFHAEMSLACLAAGRHVLVEKPLATTLADARLVADAARDSGQIAMVGHTFLYSNPVLQLRDIVRSGELGAVKYLYSQRLSLGRIRQDCDAAWNFAPHDISIMLFLLDETPQVVSATGFSFINKGIDDVCFASLQFASGVGANIHVSWIDPRKTRLLTVVGDRQMAVYDDVSVDQKLWIHDAGVAGPGASELGSFASMGEFQSRTRVGDIRLPFVKPSEPLRVEVEAFAAACRSGTPPLTDAGHGVDVVAVLAALSESARANGAPVEVTR